MITMTYGEMPAFEQFSAQWDAQDEAGELRDGLFYFGNDKRVGDAEFDKFRLWDELGRASKEYSELLEGDTDKDPEVVGQWISTVLSCLGFEWI